VSEALREKQVLAAAIRKRDLLKRRDSFDAYFPDSRPTEKQWEVLNGIHSYMLRYVTAGNQSGKSLLAARECAWVFEDNHPTFKPREVWGERPLTMIILGRTSKQMDEELWSKKIRPHLDPQCFTEHRVSQSLVSVKNKHNGNTILFISHNNVNEARENSQAFVAHWVWLDEMPDSISLFAELEMRVIANRGRFIATFTPLIKNLEIKNKIDNVDPRIGKKYQFSMLDNPIYAGREDELLAQFNALPEGERRARLYGEWFFGDRNVYSFKDQFLQDPLNYSPSWRHMEVVDPAASSDSGYSLWAECPITKVWYCIKAKYIPGDAASELLQAFQRESAGYNVIKRRTDPHEVFFIKEANKAKVFYEGVYAKNNNLKMDLIKNVQEMFNNGRIKITTWAGDDIIQELLSCQWSETKADTIMFKSRFHILDTVQYFCYDIPKPVDMPASMEWEAQLRFAHKQRKAQEYQAKDKKVLNFGKFRPRIAKRSL
jgi:phage terminase large subunit-like protein